MSKKINKIILYSIIAGLSLWILDSISDHLFFHEGTFAELLLTDVPFFEIHDRLIFLAVCLVCALIIIKINDKRQKELEKIDLQAAILEQSMHGICISDKEGVIEYVNPVYCKSSGYSKQELQGAHVDIVKSGKHSKEFYENVWGTLSSGNPWYGRMIVKSKDGNFCHHQVAVSPIFDKQGKIIKYVGMGRDVTRELELEQQFHQSQKMESIGILAGGIAHDFNNLLTVINGYAEMSLSLADYNVELLNNLKQILAASKKAQNLTRQLLAYSRKQVLEMKPVNVNDLVRDMEKMLERILGEDIELKTVFSERAKMILADKGKIEQVIFNLAVNAREAMQSGGKLMIETSLEMLDENYTKSKIEVIEGEYIMIAVSDNGRGMTEEIQNRIFEPFFTTKESGKGTGLGLSTVQGIVKQHSGNIWVYSEPNKGTTFKIYLPVAEPVEVMKEGDEEIVMREQQNGIIMLVEDNQDVLQIAENILKSSGYEVYSFNDPDESIEFVKLFRGKIDLLITDVIMPKRNGSELQAKIKTILPDIKVLFVSGYTDNIISQHGVLGENVNFLEKPFTYDSLSRKVSSILRKH